MANLGRCLLFYLKYPAEMERLYEADEPRTDGLSNPDQVLERIKLVGDTAGREAAEFLESCAPGIVERFPPIGKLERVRNSLEDSWDLRFRVLPKKATKLRVEIGVYIDYRRAALAPWLWCRGGRRVEDEVVRILNRGTKAATLGYHSGTVRLAEIKIPFPEGLEEPVECSSLVAQVQQAFVSLTAQEIKAIVGIAGSRGAP